ncbi:MAG: hypothetical protein GC204_13930 [Chloroflexi bacterium]|nr:hypothetical protein [Chloroflexota bacterium]
MVAEHEQWIAQAAELARRKKFDEARELALQVVREDGRNPRALWIVASTTASLTERRNALNALLRVQPDNLHARQMLDALNHDSKSVAPNTNDSSNSSKSSTAIRSIAPTSNASQPMMLYTAVILAALVIVAAVIVAVRIA